MGVDQPCHGRTGYRGSFEVVEQERGLTLLVVYIPKEIEDFAVGGILLKKLNVMIGKAGIGLSPGGNSTGDAPLVSRLFRILADYGNRHPDH